MQFVRKSPNQRIIQHIQTLVQAFAIFTIARVGFDGRISDTNTTLDVNRSFLLRLFEQLDERQFLAFKLVIEVK